MKHYLLGLFQPLENRYYNGWKRSTFLYALRHLPVAGLLLWGALEFDRIFWLLFVVYVIGATLKYTVLDRISDYIAWSAFWSKFYTDKHKLNSEEDRLLKKYSKHPNDINKEALENFYEIK